MSRLLAAWPAVLGAAAAVAITTVIPSVSPLLWALAIGAVLANTPWGRSGTLHGSQPGAKTLLRIGIVLFGSTLSLGSIASLGPTGLLAIVLTVVVVLGSTFWLGDRLGMERGLVTLIAAGFAVCGAAAVATVEHGIRRKDEDVALALALVTVFGTVMIPLIPLLARLLGLSPAETGVWAGASIHEVAQVVAAASLVGGAAVMSAAVTVKLGRVALLVLAHLASRWRHRDEAAPGAARTGGLGTYVPWFLVGFVLMAVLRSLGLLPEPLLGPLRWAGIAALAAGMFGLGLGIVARDLLPLRWRPVLLATFATGVATLVPLLVIGGARLL